MSTDLNAKIDYAIEPDTIAPNLENDRLLEPGTPQRTIEFEDQKIIFGPQDPLYEDDEGIRYEDHHQSEPFRVTAVHFLMKELDWLVNNHKIELDPQKEDETPALIIKQALRCADLLTIENRLPKYIGAKALLRLALKKVLYFKLKKNFELDGIPKTRLKMGKIGKMKKSRKYPSNAEQKNRQECLEKAQIIAEKNPLVRARILEVLNVALKMQIPPDMFNRGEIGGIEPDQQNALAINFLFWTLNKSSFTENHIAVALLALYKSPDWHGVVQDYSNTKNPSDDSSKIADEVEQLYTEITQELESHGQTWFNEFLAEFRPDGKSRTAVRHQTKYGRSRSVKDSYTHEPDELHPNISTNNMKVLLRSVDAVLARYGNFGARNRFVQGLLNFARYMSRSTFDREETFATVSLELLEKVVAFDVRMGNAPSTYAFYWIRQIIRDSMGKNRSVIIPKYLKSAIRCYNGLIQQFPNVDIEAIDNMFRKTKYGPSIKKVKASRNIGTTISLDKKINNAYESDTTLYNFIFDQEQNERGMAAIMEKDVINKIEMIIDSFPPIYNILLRLRMGIIPGQNRSANLQQIGDLYGLTRERIRQLKEQIRKKLITRCYTVDEEALAEYATVNGLTDQDILIIKLFLGLEKRVYYKRCDEDSIVIFLEKNTGARVSLNEVKDVINCKKRKLFAYQSQTGKDRKIFKKADSTKPSRMLHLFLFGQTIDEESQNLSEKRELAEFFKNPPMPLDVDWQEIAKIINAITADEETMSPKKSGVFRIKRSDGERKQFREKFRTDLSELDIAKIAEEGLILMKDKRNAKGPGLYCLIAANRHDSGRNKQPPVHVSEPIDETKTRITGVINQIFSGGDEALIAQKLIIEKKTVMEIADETGLDLAKVMTIAGLVRIELEAFLNIEE